MTDYYPLITRAVAGLDKGTGDARRAIYERAREVLVRLLRAVTPALDESDVARERLSLEEAIRKVEGESARESTRASATALRAKAPEFPRWDEPDPEPEPQRPPGAVPIDPLADMARRLREALGPRFKESAAVRRWLRRQSQEVAVVFAARAALRVIPMLAGKYGQVKLGRNIVLEAFRCVAVSWATAAYPGHLTELQATALSARSVVRQHISNAESAAMYASETASGVLSAEDTVDTAGSAGERAVDAAAEAGSKAFDAILNALATDANLLDQRLSAASLATNSKLWPDQVPEWAQENWDRLKGELLTADEGWEAWTEWYEDRLHGRTANQALEVARATIKDEIWMQGPQVVNAEIKALIEEPGIFQDAITDEPEPIRDPLLVVVPAQRPAAVEPIWRKGRLTLPRKSAKSDLGTKKFTSALKGLRTELCDFADNIVGEANIDRRFVSFVRDLADRIPPKSPPQDELFRLGHSEAVFAGYARTVNEQWPEFLASQYHALALHFDRTMRQSPLWRAFKRNAAQQGLSTDQIGAAISLATETARALLDGEGTQFVDPAVAEALQHLVEPLRAFEATPQSNASPDAIEAGKELLAVDLIESVNNIFKRVAEAALVAKASATLRGVGSTLVKAGKVYAGGLGPGVISAAKKQGPKDGKKLFKWFRRIAIAGPPGAGTYVGLSHLIAKYPEAFTWIESIFKSHI